MTCCIPPKELHGYGAILQRYDCVTADWITIGGTSDLEIPAFTREKSENNSDDGDGTMHYTPSPQHDLDDVSFDIDYRDGQYRNLLNIAKNVCFANSGEPWRVVLNNETQTFYRWCAYISSLGASIPKGEIVSSSLTLSTTGGGIQVGELNG
jgi:hypothetical protein